MEKIVNDIYNDCEDLSYDQITCLIDNLETLAESIWAKEDSENEYEEDPNQTVARENCEAIS